MLFVASYFSSVRLLWFSIEITLNWMMEKQQVFDDGWKALCVVVAQCVLMKFIVIRCTHYILLWISWRPSQCRRMFPCLPTLYFCMTTWKSSLVFFFTWLHNEWICTTWLCCAMFFVASFRFHFKSSSFRPANKKHRQFY